MGNNDLQKFPKEGSQSRSLPSPKLTSLNMSQSKTTTGSPKSSPKSPDGSPKFDSASSSPSKSGHSPSSAKSSPGSSKILSLTDRLIQSKTLNKNSQKLKSPGSKSPPSSPNTSIAKTDVFQECTDQILKSDEAEKNVCDGSSEVKLDNNQLSSGEQLVIVESKPSVLNSDIKQEVSIESDRTEVKENEVKSESNDVINVEDPEKSIKPLRIDDSVILEQTSKKDIRQKVWEFMEENSLVVFPKPCFNRIPNFKGCNNASQMLEKLEEFKKAKTVQVTPDKAQEIARFITLSWGKRLLVPLLRLKEGLLQIVSLPFAEPSTKVLKLASTQKGLRKWGNKLITLDHNSDGHHIDMIILGSVTVDRKGHRIGIGNGLCDLEFAILSYMNMVTDKTVVVTIVHDAQVFDSLPTDIFKPYDVPVDIIITQTEIIKVENRLDRPKDVFWNYISKRRLLEMPPLQLLRTKQEKNGDIDCTLKDVDSEPEDLPSTPKVYKKFKGYRRRRSYSTRSETNDSVFKDIEVVKRRSNSKQSSAAVLKNSELKAKRKRAKSTSSQQHLSNSVVRSNKPNGQKDNRSSSKKPNKRRTKSESAKTVTSPPIESDSKNSNGVQATSPSSDTPKNKRRSRQKPRQRVNSDDMDKQSIRQSNVKANGNNRRSSRSSSRVTRRDYIDRQDFGRDLSMGRKTLGDYDVQSPRKYYSQSRRPSYSQDRQSNGNFRSNSRVRYEINRPAGVQQNRYPNGPVSRPSRYFNGQMVRHNNFFNGPISRQNGMNNHVIRHNNYANGSLPRQNNYYDGVINRNNYSKGSAIRQDGYNSRVFRPPVYRNEMVSQTDKRNFLRESRPRFNYNNQSSGYFNSNEMPNYSRSNSGDEFVLKVGNIANNVRVRDLKAALMDRGVKPLHITWRGPRGFAYLRYNNSTEMNKDNIMGSLQNVRIKPNGVETAQTQTLIVTECQFS